MKGKPKRRVLIAFPQYMAFLERLLQGVLAYARQQGHWSVARLPEAHDANIKWLRGWPGDGALVLIASPADARMARSLKLPVVNLAALVRRPPVPTVMVDHAAVGKLAAEHLLKRQFRHFGYYGIQGRWFSELRREGFCEEIRAAGRECQLIEAKAAAESMTHWRDEQADLERWVRRLPRPIGIMACNDPRAAMVLDACQAAGLSVPEDVAIIGADNDPVVCEGGAVPLSSVARQDQEVGFQAAKLLDRLMLGEAAPAAPVLIPPEGVVSRRSTQTHAIEDPVVAEAVNYVHAHLHETFGVERLLEQSRLSRRRFELRFEQCLGCSPYEFILRQRVDRAGHLLANPGKHRLTDIAGACGFTDLRHFRNCFRRITGQAPAQYKPHS